MPPVPKHIKASRNNGGKAKNKGNLTGNKVKIIREKIGVTPPAGEHIVFETVIRAKPHKRSKYADQMETEFMLKVAKGVLARVERGTWDPKGSSEWTPERARSVLAAYQAAASSEP